MRRLIILPLFIFSLSVPAASAAAPRLSSSPHKLCKQYKKAAKLLKRKGHIYTRAYCLDNFDGVLRVGNIASQDEGATSFKALARAWTRGVRYCDRLDWIDPPEGPVFCEDPNLQDDQGDSGESG